VKKLKRQVISTIAVSAIITAFGGCAMPQGPATQASNANSAERPLHTDKASAGSIVMTLECPTSGSVPNARYIGPYQGVENNLKPEHMAQDLYCADLFKSKNYPKGFVTIYGSSRILEANNKGDAAVIAANNKLYQEIKSFAYKWTQRYGVEYPIMTGAGPGLMEAGSRGAKEAGKSIGYTTYYDPGSGDPARYYGGDASRVFWKYNSQDIITDGLIFSSVAIRETSMIMHSAAIVIAPGGTGTEWEIFQILETIKSKQLIRVPVYIVGDRTMYWKSFEARLGDMVRRTAVKDGEVTQYIEYVDNAEDVVEKLKTRLGLN
jgi:predicted Rossmann-fold nucleotide-binding protein